MSAELVRICGDEERARMIGKIIHVEGWPHGCQFRLEKIDGPLATIITPKGGKRYTVDVLRLCYSRKSEPLAEPEKP